MIESLSKVLQKQFDDNINKRDDIYYVINGNPGYVIVITGKDIVIIKVGFLAKSSFNTFRIIDYYHSKLTLLINDNKNEFKVINSDNNSILDIIKFPNNKSKIFKEILNFLDENKSNYLKKLKTDELNRKRKEQERVAKEKEEERKRIEEENRILNEKREPIKKFLETNLKSLPIQDKAYDIFKNFIKSGFALCFVGEDGLGKATTVKSISEKYNIPIFNSELSLYEHPEWICFYDEAQDLNKKLQNKLIIEIDYPIIKAESGYGSRTKYHETIFRYIFATTDEVKLIPELRKRLLYVYFQPYTLDEMKFILGHLSGQYESNFLYEIEEKVLINILKYSKGNPGELVRILRLIEGKQPEKVFDLLGISEPNNQCNFESIRSMSPFEFQEWVIKALGGKDSESKVGDMGIDGYIESDNFWHSKAAIQVKQFDNIGRNVIDNFETAMKRAKFNKGYIVAYSFTNGAIEETKRAKSEENLDITLLTAEEILRRLKK